MTGFILVIISALFHAGWNVLLKKSKAKFRFNLNMHIASVIIFAACLPVLYPDAVYFEHDVILYGFIASLFFAAYQLLVAKAYELSDVSQVYPITTSSPLFVTVWAAIFLHESISLIGITGIIITIGGCIIMNGASLSKTKFQGGVIAALMAAFAYSFGSLFDKVGVNTGNAVMYTFWMNLFMTVFFVLLFLLRHKREIPCKADRKYIIPAGLIIVLSALTYRFGVAEMNISYAVAIRQVSGLFGVIMGIIFFKEGYGRMRFIGALIIIVGVILLRVGM